MPSIPKPVPQGFVVDIDLLKEALGRLITRNETNPVARATFRIGYAKNMRDLETNPDRHLAGAVDIIARHGPTYEAGLQLGACMALCAVKGTRYHETFSRMLAEIKAQQDDEEKPVTKETDNGKR